MEEEAPEDGEVGFEELGGEMAYSDYGAFVHVNGERRRDKEDVGVYDTDEANLPSGLRIYANLIKNMEDGINAWWRHSQHGVMGDGQVRVACYKQGFPSVYSWPDGADEPHEFSDSELIGHNGWTEDDPWVSVKSWDDSGELYIEPYYDDDVSFTVPGLEGYEFSYGKGQHYWAAMREPDGTEWECDYDYLFGAGFEEERR